MALAYAPDDEAREVSPHRSQSEYNFFSVFNVIVGLLILGMAAALIYLSSHQANNGQMTTAPAMQAYQPQTNATVPPVNTDYKHTNGLPRTAADLMGQFADAYGIPSYTITAVQVTGTTGWEPISPSADLAVYPSHVGVTVSFTHPVNIIPVADKAVFERIGSSWSMALK